MPAVGAKVRARVDLELIAHWRYELEEVQVLEAEEMRRVCEGEDCTQRGGHRPRRNTHTPALVLVMSRARTQAKICLMDTCRQGIRLRAMG